LRHPGMWNQLLPAAYLFALTLVLICSVYTLWRARQHSAAATIGVDAMVEGSRPKASIGPLDRDH
jgi:alpha-1,2-mannosyltransferase